jgi:hypothetical protein
VIGEIMRVPTLTAVEALFDTHAAVPPSGDLLARRLSTLRLAPFDLVVLLEELSDMFGLDEQPAVVERDPTVRQL